MSKEAREIEANQIVKSNKRKWRDRGSTSNNETRQTLLRGLVEERRVVVSWLSKWVGECETERLMTSKTGGPWVGCPSDGG